MISLLRVAIGACVLSGGVCATSLWLASRPVVLPGPARVPATPLTLATVARRAAPADSDVAVAIDHDPFAPDRHRPAVRYQLPEEIAAAATQPTAPSGVPHLLGTVVSPGGSSFAMCQIGAEPPRMVRIGDVVSGFKLERVSQGAALFLSATGSRVELNVLKASGS